MNTMMQLLLTALTVHGFTAYQVLWFIPNKLMLPEWYRSLLAVVWVLSLAAAAVLSLVNIWGQ